MKAKKIGLVVGSLRKDSWNRKIADNLIRLAPASLDLEIIDISKLPLYNQDDDSNPPVESKNFKTKIELLDGVIFLTPEYNRSMPGVLKNALDIASRPYGKNAWNEKPAAVISVSIGAIGGFGANQHLRQVLAYLNMPCLTTPEIYIGNVAELFDGNNQLAKGTEELLQKFITNFVDWMQQLCD